MKLIIEPTEPQVDVPHDQLYPRVAVEYPTDDLNAADIIELMVIPALTTYGFTKETVQDAINQLAK